jgi:hypothetical protein
LNTKPVVKKGEWTQTMKANKILKRITKIEALISKLTERSSANAPYIHELLRDARVAISRAKRAVSFQASSGAAGNPPVRGGELPPKPALEPSKPKRKLSAAGRKAISEATNRRWAAKRAAVKAAPAVAKKATTKKSAPAKTVAAPARKSAKKAPTKKAAVKAHTTQKAAKKPASKKAAKAPAKKAARVVQADDVQPVLEPAATTAPVPEQPMSDAPVQ